MTKLMSDWLRTMLLLDDGDAGGGDGGGKADDAGGDGDGKDGDADGGDDDSLIGGKPKDKDQTSDDDGGKSKDGDAAGAPEKYEDFAIPEGFEIDQSRLEAFVPVARELGLTQDQAQKIVDLQVKLAEQDAAAAVEQSKQWVEELRKDPDVGGAKFAANVERVRHLVESVAGEDLADLRTYLNQGHGNYPPLFRLLHRIASRVSEDSFDGKTGTRTKSKEEVEAELLKKRYPRMTASLGDSA